MATALKDTTIMLSRVSLGSHLGYIALMSLVEQVLRAILIWICVQIFFNPTSEHGVAQWISLGAVVCFFERFIACRVGIRATAWVETLFSSYVGDYSQSKRLGSFAWLNEDARDQDVPFLATESLQAVEESVAWFVDFSKNSAALLVMFFAFVFLTQATFFPFLLFSLVAGYILARWLWHRHQDSAQLINEGRGRLSMLLLGSWDNVALGNEHNRKHWNSKFLKELHRVGQVRNKQFLESFLENSVTILFVSLPLFVYLFHEFQNAQNLASNPAAVFLLIYVSLHLRAFPACFFGSLSFPSLFKTLAKVQRVATRPIASVPEDRLNVDWNQLMIAKEGVRSRLKQFSDVASFTRSFSPARYTLMGPEHCGKTAFLLNVKNLHPDKSFFLPGQSTLSFEFETNDDEEFKSVEDVEDRLLKCLKELKSVSQGGIILLDDWDVYLDPATAQKVSLAIDELALFRCVFETRRTAY
jgi:hypothetical protein